MPRFAANLTLLYNEHAFLDRFKAAAADGFRAVEFLFHYDHPREVIAERVRAAGLEVVLLNAPPGDWAGGEKGLALAADRERDFQASVNTALDYARAVGSPRVHVLAGLVAPGADREVLRARYVERLRWAAAAAAPHGIDILIEPLNTRDNPGYFLNRQSEGRAVIDAVGASNLRLQFDLYHVQIVEGDLAMRLREFMPYIGHIQIAGVPERHEPSVGEINYPYIFELMDSLNYKGWVSAEYRPRAGTSAGLDWVRSYLRKAA
jgi:2-dehydrotetronate isomerase